MSFRKYDSVYIEGLKKQNYAKKVCNDISSNYPNCSDGNRNAN